MIQNLMDVAHGYILVFEVKFSDGIVEGLAPRNENDCATDPLNRRAEVTKVGRGRGAAGKSSKVDDVV